MNAFIERNWPWILLTSLLLGLLILERSEAAGLTVNPVSVGAGEAAQVAWTADAADDAVIHPLHVDLRTGRRARSGVYDHENVVRRV